MASPPPEGSVTAQLAARYPEARWVKGFSTFGSDFHRDPSLDEGIDVHLAGDDSEAKERPSLRSRKAPAFIPSMSARYATPRRSRTWPSCGFSWPSRAATAGTSPSSFGAARTLAIASPDRCPTSWEPLSTMALRPGR